MIVKCSILAMTSWGSHTYFSVLPRNILRHAEVHATLSIHIMYILHNIYNIYIYIYIYTHIYIYSSCSSRSTTSVSCSNAFLFSKNAVYFAWDIFCLAASLPLKVEQFSSVIKLFILRSYACNANGARKHLL